MENYIIVLFKNKKRKRIIKKFITLSRSKLLYDKLLKVSNDIIFDVQFENGSPCKYELGLIEMSANQLVPVYITDEMGRNIKVKLEDDNMTLLQISSYKKDS